MYLSPAMAGNVRPNSLGAYIFAAICVAIATLVRVAVFEWVTLTFPTYYVAVLLVSLVGGFFSALFAIALSVIAAWWLFMPPTLEFGAPTTVHIINSLFFIGMSLAIAWMGNANRLLLEDLKKERDQSHFCFPSFSIGEKTA
jgi:K+-sensing histidine kinase KdpD